VRIARKALINIYGKEVVRQEEPFSAMLYKGNWIVTGTLPKGWVGGVAQVIIGRADGCIIHIEHGQ
jgi:hypothetical protein